METEVVWWWRRKWRWCEAVVVAMAEGATAMAEGAGGAEVAVGWAGGKVASYREALMWEHGGAVGKEADGDSEGVGGRWHRIS